jgi:hypothetical protein
MGMFDFAFFRIMHTVIVLLSGIFQKPGAAFSLEWRIYCMRHFTVLYAGK